MPTNTFGQDISKAGGSIVPTSTVPAISASTLSNPPQPMKVPVYTPPQLGNFTPASSPQLADATANAQNSMNGAQTDLKATYDQLATQPQAQQQLEQQAGIPGIKSHLSELNALDAQYAADLNNLGAQTLQSQLKSENRQAPMFAITGEQAQAARQSAFLQQNINIKRTTNAAAMAAANGQLALAQDYVTKAMDYQFKPLEYQLEYKKMVYEQNKDQFTKAEQRQYDAQLSSEAHILEQQKQDRSAILAMATAAAKNYPDNPSALFSVQQAIKSNDLVQAFNLIGQYQSDPMAISKAIIDNQYKQAQINKLNADIRKVNSEIGGSAMPHVSPTASGQYMGSLQVILGSAKFTKDQKASVIEAVNNGQDPTAVIRNQAKNLMSGANQTKVESYETALQSLQAIDQQLQAFYAAGGKTNIFNGNFEKVVNKLGQVNDPALVDIATQIQQNLQVYRNAVSGTAYSVQEGNDIASIFPGINKSQGLNNAIISGRTKAMNDTVDAAYRGVLGSTYDDLKKVPTASRPQSNPSIPAGAIRIVRNGQEGYITNMMEFDPKTDKKI